CAFASPPIPHLFTLSLHDALPISAKSTDPNAYFIVLLGGEAGLRCGEIMALEWSDVDLGKRQLRVQRSAGRVAAYAEDRGELGADRKSTRLNSSHEWISYAVFCLK